MSTCSTSTCIGICLLSEGLLRRTPRRTRAICKGLIWGRNRPVWACSGHGRAQHNAPHFMQSHRHICTFRRICMRPRSKHEVMASNLHLLMRHEDHDLHTLKAMPISKFTIQHIVFLLTPVLIECHTYQIISSTHIMNTREYACQHAPKYQLPYSIRVCMQGCLWMYVSPNWRQVKGRT